MRNQICVDDSLNDRRRALNTRLHAAQIQSLHNEFCVRTVRVEAAYSGNKTGSPGQTKQDFHLRTPCVCSVQAYWSNVTKHNSNDANNNTIMSLFAESWHNKDILGTSLAVSWRSFANELWSYDALSHAKFVLCMWRLQPVYMYMQFLQINYYKQWRNNCHRSHWNVRKFIICKFKPASRRSQNLGHAHVTTCMSHTMIIWPLCN